MSKPIIPLASGANTGALEKLIEIKTAEAIVFEGKFINIYCDTITLPNGQTATREWLKHPGASAVAPITADGDIILVKQWRYPIHKATWEIPAGKFDNTTESPESLARRELQEETGCLGGELTYLGPLHSAPAFTNEVIHLYMAKGFTEGVSSPDEDEFLEVRKFKFDDVLAMIRTNEITDAKTISAILWIQAFNML
jgi:ADP-ribose pyrophosphatase